ncbi:MAG: xanthine dehydrogenase family protein molybdopterin-binding subunit [Pseudomonadota bacterium]
MTDRRANGEFGLARPRREDRRFLTGAGRYIDDIRLERMAHAVILRSPHSHAVIESVDTADARSASGVLAVLTADDMGPDGVGALLPSERVNDLNGAPFAFTPYPPLATDRVRHVGQPIALVVAESPTAARDAAERIKVRYNALPAVTLARDAVRPGAVELDPAVPGNIVLEHEFGEAQAVDRIFGDAPHVTALELFNHRVVTNPMEPRGAIGTYDAPSDSYTLHVSSQSIHANRDNIALALNVPPDRLRFVAPDVGGGFGSKNFPYVEHILPLWAARRTGRPVKWVNDRSAGFVSDHQARDHWAEAELAYDETGRFLALRIRSWANVGAYLSGSTGKVQIGQYLTLPNTLYDIPALHLVIGAATTNTVPIGVTRGPGFAETVNILERLIDSAARASGIDRLALRRRNLIGARAMPYTAPTGTPIDSGDFKATLDTADALVDGFAERRRSSEARGLLLGLGFSMHIKATGGAPEEKVELSFGDGKVVLTTGTQSIGQGHETTFRQIVSARLGVPFDDIDYRAGDTALISKGGGHGSSRATYMGGTTIVLAVRRIVEKGLPVAARLLEASPEDVAFEDGQFLVAGTDRSVDVMTVAAAAREDGMVADDGYEGLDTAQEFVREAMTYPNGCHVAEVEIDPETGRTIVVRYMAIDDYGNIVNPLIAQGQVHGAIAQGIGQALLEHGVYEAGSGQLLAGSFMDYTMPRADDLPSFDVQFLGVPCTTNPLGVKGCGEGGSIAAYPAVANAIGDALRTDDVHAFDGPATAERVWRALKAGRPGDV